MEKPKVAIHTFTSCGGCQLAFLSLNIDLFEMSSAVNVVHFAELGIFNPNAKVDVAFVSGGVAWPHEIAAIKRIRNNCRFFITIGACATAGGIQILKSLEKNNDLSRRVYATPDYVRSLKKSWVIADVVTVDFEVWGCPITSKQCLEVIRSLSPQVSVE